MGRLSTGQREENDNFVELVRQIKEEGNDEAFEKIAKALHTYLQHLSIKKFRIAGNNSDDIYQEGLFALSTKAIPDYKQEKGAFLAFAKLCIRRHIITVLKSANNNKNKALNGSVSMDSPSDANDDEEGQVPVSWHLDTGQENVVRAFIRREVYDKHKEELERKLTELEMKVLNYYLQNMSYEDIVKAMNRYRRNKNRVYCKTIDNALCRIKKKSQELLEEIGAKNKRAEKRKT